MLKNYIKIAYRNLVKGKLYSVINISGLALGMSSVLLIFLYMQHEFSFDEYHEKKERIHRITAYSGFNEKSWQSYSSGNPVVEMRNNFTGVEDAVRMTSCSDGPIVVGDNEYSEVDIFCTESNIFNIFSFPLIAGSNDNILDTPFTAVISQSTGERIFGEQNPVGKRITFNWDGGKKDFEVTGIMEDIPLNTHFRYDIFLSYKSLESTRRCLDCGQLMYTLLEENADTAAVANLVLNHIREVDGKNYVDDIQLQPLKEIHFSSLHAQRKGNWQYIQILSIISLVLLVLGCSNYMNLATARYSKRSQEVGIRKVLGAKRSQLTRQFMLETVLLTLLTVPFVVLLIELSIPWFNMYAETEINFSFTENVGFYAALISVVLVTGFVAGSYPAFFVSNLQPREILQGIQNIKFGSAWLQKGLVTFQFLASIVLISVTFLILQQLRYIQQKNLGFESDQLVSVRINDPSLIKKGSAIKQEFLKYGSVASVTASPAPTTSRFANINHTFVSDSIPEKKYTFLIPRIDSDFLETMNVNLLAGRNISPQNGDGKREVLINKTGVETLGFTEYSDILDREVADGYRIVGVVEDFHLENLKNEIGPAFLEPDPYNSAHEVTIRLAGGDIVQGLEDLHSAWTALGASSPLDYRFVDDLIQEQYEQEQRIAWVIGVFATLSIIIACMGLFGLAALTAERRTKEIGIRKVLGATLPNIVTLLTKGFIPLIIIGFVIATPIAWYAMNRWLANFAYKIEIGAGVFLMAGFTALIIAMLTVSWQSIRAALANPVDSLRSE